MKISQKDVQSLPDGKYMIAECLFLKVVEAKGYRSYVLRVRQDGKVRDISIGSARKITLAQAKARARHIREEIDAGTYESDRQKKEERQTFADLAFDAIDAIETARQWKNEKHAHQWRQTVRDYALPFLGHMRMQDIEIEDVLSVVKPIWTEKPETATRLLTRLEMIFDWAILMRKYRKPNPARYKGQLEMLLPSKKKVLVRKHHEAITLDEAKRFAQYANESHLISYIATLFGLMTACRCNEFILARWEDIDIENRVFSVPPERRKDGKAYPHRVPLSDQAVELLNRLDRKCEFVFHRNGRHLSLETPRMTLRRFLGRPVTAHGCRSTFRDWCAETGQDPIFAEKSLMHATGNETQQAYQRSDLLEQRRELMQAWSDELLTEEQGQKLSTCCDKCE